MCEIKERVDVGHFGFFEADRKQPAVNFADTGEIEDLQFAGGVWMG